MVLNNHIVTENIKEEIKKYRETNENKHINPKSAGRSKTVLRGTFTVIKAYLGK